MDFHACAPSAYSPARFPVDMRTAGTCTGMPVDRSKLGGVNCLYLPVYGRHSVKRFLICGLLSVFFLSGLCAGPFGLSMGMNLDEIRDACGGVRPEKAAEVSGLDFDDDMYVISPEKTHSAFEVYFAWVDEDAGLYAIRAASSEIPDTDYGENVKARFYSVAESISKTYGKPEIADAYRGERGLFDGDSMWMMALTRGDRILQSVWRAESGQNLLSGDVAGIVLATLGVYSGSSTSGYAGVLRLDYIFANGAAVAEQEENVF